MLCKMHPGVPVYSKIFFFSPQKFRHCINGNVSDDGTTIRRAPVTLFATADAIFEFVSCFPAAVFNKVKAQVFFSLSVFTLLIGTTHLFICTLAEHIDFFTPEGFFFSLTQTYEKRWARRDGESVRVEENVRGHLLR